MCLLSVIEDCDLRADSLPITFMYLACVLDAYARRCVSRHLLRSIDSRLTLATRAGTHPPFRPWGQYASVTMSHDWRASARQDVGPQQSV